MKSSVVSERPLAVPVSLVAIDRLARNLAQGDRLASFVTDSKRLINGFSSSDRKVRGAAKKLAERFATKYPESAQLRKSARVQEWAEMFRSQDLDSITAPIKHHAQKLASKLDVKAMTWARHPAVLSLERSRLRSRFFPETVGVKAVTVGFLIFLLIVVLIVILILLMLQ